MLITNTYTVVGAIAIPFLLVGCSSDGNGTGGGTQPDDPALAERGSLQIYENDTCVASDVRVLVNDGSGQLVGDLRTDDQGFVSTEGMPTDGSIGVVFSYRIGVPGAPEFTTVSHVDLNLLHDIEALTILAPLLRCVDSYNIKDLLTVSATNGQFFNSVSFAGAGSSGYDQFEPDSGKVIGLGFDESGIVKYGLAHTNVVPGSNVPLNIDRDIREITWQASTTPPGNIALILADGKTYVELSSDIPMGAVNGTLPMVAEPGTMLARATYTSNDPFSQTVYIVTEQIAADALSDSHIEFSGVAPHDIHITSSSVNQMTYSYTGGTQIGLVEATQFSPSMQRSYSTDNNLGYVAFPELPSDLYPKLSGISEVSIRLDSLDPVMYPSSFGLVMPRPENTTLIPPYVDHVSYKYIQTVSQ